jgi:uncharacterized C2H2 Zn-finger protein
MITLPYDTAVAVFLTITVGFVVVLWMIYTYTENGGLPKEDLEYLIQCPYCTYVFFDRAPENTVSCPRCQSLVNTVNVSVRFTRKNKKERA